MPSEKMAVHRSTPMRFLSACLVAMTMTLMSACGGGSGDSTPAAAVPVVTAPAITAQPVDASVTAGATASFSVTASGTAPLAYQWSSSTDGVNFSVIAGATTSSYATGAAVLAQTGTQFRVVVSNSAGSVTSSAVRLTVSALVIAPAITVQPANQSVIVPSPATFNVTATGTALSYQWQVSTDNGSTYAAVAGAADSPTFTLAATTAAMNNQRYKVRVSNSAGNVTSAEALLHVDAIPLAPTITTQPVATSVAAGLTANFTIAATGVPVPTIQWRLNTVALVNGLQAGGACAGATVSGATGNTLSLATVPLGCNGAMLSALVSNGTAPDAPSASVALGVTVPMPPVITTQPASQTVLTGAAVTFNVVATGPALTYQWRRSGANIVGATSASYTTPPVSSADSGAVYTVVVTNADATVTSAGATLTLTLSADQQAFEGLILTGGGSYELHWNLNYSGTEVSGTNYANSDFALLTQSPLTNGPQTVMQSAAVNMATTLAAVAPTPVRSLVNGSIVVIPNQQTSVIRYVGSQIQVDELAADGVTVARSQLRSGYQSIALTGNVKAASGGDLAHWFNSFFSNTTILNGTTSWAAGARYITYSAVNKGDRYTVFDCSNTVVTTGSAPSACNTGTTLTAALTAGEASTSDGVTYHLADGTITTVGGVPVWVATTPRPAAGALSSTVQYRIYFQLNGNVYTGSLVRDGVALGGNYYVITPGTLGFVPFQLRLNKAARDSITADLAI